MSIEFSETERVWLACAIDTDGHIGMKNQRVKRTKGGKTYHYNYILPLLGFSNTHSGIVIHFAELIDSKHHESKESKPYDHKYKYSVATLSTKKVRQILTQIIPYLIVKKERATYVLNFCEFKIANPGDHSTKSNRRQEKDLKWYEEYREKYPNHRRNRGRIP